MHCGLAGIQIWSIYIPQCTSFNSLRLRIGICDKVYVVCIGLSPRILIIGATLVLSLSLYGYCQFLNELKELKKQVPKSQYSFSSEFSFRNVSLSYNRAFDWQKCTVSLICFICISIRNLFIIDMGVTIHFIGKLQQKYDSNKSINNLLISILNLQKLAN